MLYQDWRWLLLGFRVDFNVASICLLLILYIIEVQNCSIFFRFIYFIYPMAFYFLIDDRHALWNCLGLLSKHSDSWLVARHAVGNAHGSRTIWNECILILKFNRMLVELLPEFADIRQSYLDARFDQAWCVLGLRDEPLSAVGILVSFSAVLILSTSSHTMNTFGVPNLCFFQLIYRLSDLVKDFFGLKKNLALLILFLQHQFDHWSILSVKQLCIKS